ncbi:MAG: hypothetical protein HY537_18060 [Deltaproteobacteria bacterium]|nr:hypothetical protein [Deltaproteobacteria bacterium]
MKIIMLGIVLIGLPLMACIDPPTPIQLTNSTLENEGMEVSATGLSSGNTTLFFKASQDNPKIGQWCWRDGKKEICGLKQTSLIRNDITNEIVGVMHINDRTRTLMLYQVKRPTDIKNYAIDKTVPYLIFTDESDKNYQRFVVKAIHPDNGTLGSVTSEHFRFLKALPPPARKAVDLRQPAVRIAGCGSADSKKNTVRSEFKSGNQARHSENGN